MLTTLSTKLHATEVKIKMKRVPLANLLTLDGLQAQPGYQRAKLEEKREKMKIKWDHTRTMGWKHHRRSLPLNEAFLGFLYWSQHL